MHGVMIFVKKKNSYTLRTYNINEATDWKITNEMEFNNVVQKLDQNVLGTSQKINKIQARLDGVAIFFIIVNLGMLAENIYWYCTNASVVDGYKTQLENLKSKAIRINDWYESCSKSEPEVNHFRTNLLQVTLELAVIETRLDALRKESLSKGLTHILTGTSTVVLSFMFPMSAPLFYGMAFSGGLNALSSIGNFKIMGDIDELLPKVNEIRSLCRNYLARVTQNGHLPSFQ